MSPQAEIEVADGTYLRTGTEITRALRSEIRTLPTALKDGVIWMPTIANGRLKRQRLEKIVQLLQGLQVKYEEVQQGKVRIQEAKHKKKAQLQK